MAKGVRLIHEYMPPHCPGPATLLVRLRCRINVAMDPPESERTVQRGDRPAESEIRCCNPPSSSRGREPRAGIPGHESGGGFSGLRTL